MKKLLLFFGCTLFLSLYSCSDDASQEEDIDVQLLIGEWRNTEACSDSEDGIIFTSNDMFISETADNTTSCNLPAVCGLRLSGEYRVSGNDLSFNNTMLESVEYTNETICVGATDASIKERFEIVELTESSLVISRFASVGGGEFTFNGSTTYARL